MQQRGRKSAADAHTVIDLADRRPAPPADLNEFQKSLWRDVVDSHSPDFFRKDTYPILRSYCKHAWHAAEIDKLIAKSFDSDDSEVRDGIDDLLKARERESRAMLAAGRSLRITNQAQIDPKTASRQRAAPSKKPWEK